MENKLSKFFKNIPKEYKGLAEVFGEVMFNEQSICKFGLDEYGESELLYRYARDVEGADIKTFEKLLIEKGNASLRYIFARDVKGADVKALEEAVINRCLQLKEYVRHVAQIYHFAKDVKGADIKRLSEAIAMTQRSEWIYQFARDIEGADIKVLEKGIIDAGELPWIYRFARDIEGADIKALSDAMLHNHRWEDNGSNENPYDMGTNCKYKFVRDVKDANNDEIKELMKEISYADEFYDRFLSNHWNNKDSIGSNERFRKNLSEYISWFLINNKLILKTFEQHLILQKNAEKIYMYAKYVEKANIKLLQKALIESGEAEWLYKFAKDIKGADLLALEKALIKTGNVEYMSKFIDEISDLKGEDSEEK